MPELNDNDDLLDQVLDSAARALSYPADETMTGHPDSEVLVAYQEKRLTDAVARRVRRHLTVCEECARDVLALDVDLDKVDPELLPGNSEIADEWAAFERKLAQEAPEPAAVGDAGPRREPTGRRRRSAAWKVRYSLAVAASIVVALGLGYRIFKEPVDTSNLFLVDLLPDGTLPVRDSSGDRDVVVPDGMSSLILRLNLGDQTPHDDYRVELRDAAGEVRWRQEALRRQPAGQFIVWVRRTEAPAGSYELTLFGIEDGEAEILATYSFQLRDAAD